MRNIFLILFLALLLGICSTPSLYAHHGNAAYDMKTTITLIGTVTKFSMANPHSWVALDVKDEKGEVTNWTVEFGVLREMKEQGWSDNTLKPGDQIKLPIHAKSDGDHAGILAGGVITYADGKPLPLNPPKQTTYRPMHW